MMVSSIRPNVARIRNVLVAIQFFVYKGMCSYWVDSNGSAFNLKKAKYIFTCKRTIEDINVMNKVNN